MSVKQQVTFVCNGNGCGEEYMLHEDMEMPPHWIGLQVAISDEDGAIPDHEREIFTHFCKQECLIEYVNSNDITERMMLVDGESDDFPPDKEPPGEEE